MTPAARPDRRRPAATRERRSRRTARSGTRRAPRMRAAAQRRPRQPVDGELNGGVPHWPPACRGGSPVFQSTTVAPPSASSNTASMRPRTTVSPMTMSNGTSTSTGVRAAHGDAMNAACSSASSSASSRASCAVDRPGQVIEVEQPLGTVEPLHPVVKGGAQQGVRVGPNRQPAVQPPRRAVGVAAEFHQAADRQLRRAALAGRCAGARSRSASRASTSAAQPSTSSSGAWSRPAIGAAHQRGPAIDVAAARACRVGRPDRLDDLVAQRVRVTVGRRGRPVLDHSARVTDDGRAVDDRP